MQASFLPPIFPPQWEQLSSGPRLTGKDCRYALHTPLNTWRCPQEAGLFFEKHQNAFVCQDTTMMPYDAFQSIWVYCLALESL